MGRKGFLDYDAIMDMYGLKKLKYDTFKYTNLRNRTKGIFKAKYQDKTWADLSQIDKEIFICKDIKQYMLNTYIPENQKKVVEKKVHDYLQNQFLNEIEKTEKLQKKFNKEREKPYEVFYNQELFEAIKDAEEKEMAIKEAYTNFVCALKDYVPNFPVPNLDEWKEQRYKNVMGYIASYFSSHNIQNTEEIHDTGIKESHVFDMKEVCYVNTDEEIEETGISESLQAAVDHTTLMTIVKVLKEQKIANIDVDKIASCYQSIYNLPNIMDYDKPLLEYNPLFEVSQKTQDDYINAFLNLRFKENQKLQKEYIKAFRNFTTKTNKRLQEKYIQAFINLVSNHNEETETKYMETLRNLHFEINKEAKEAYIQKIKKMNFGKDKEALNKYIEAFLNLLLEPSGDKKAEYMKTFYNLHFENHQYLQNQYINTFKRLHFGIPKKLQEEYINAFWKMIASSDSQTTREKHLRAIKQLNIEINEEMESEYIEAFRKLHFDVSNEAQEKYITAFKNLIHSGVSRTTQESYIEVYRKYVECDRQITELDFLKPM